METDKTTQPSQEEKPDQEQEQAEPKLSKKALKKLEKEKKKAELKEKRAAEIAQEQAQEDGPDYSEGKYGDLEPIMSTIPADDRYSKKYTRIGDITSELVGSDILVRTRLHTSRVKGGSAFLVLREQGHTIQATIFKSETISKQMIRYVKSISTESFVEIVGTVVEPKEKVEGCTQKELELQILTIHTISRSLPRLPFELDVASQKVENQLLEMAGEYDDTQDVEEKKEAKACVKQKTRLDNRIIDLRITSNQAIFRLQAGVSHLFRDFLMKEGFMEIHSPKLIQGASETGATVFKLKYFDKSACLAQSPQFFKQMAVCCDFERVFEVAPVFRAENSNTKRHLCEFTSLDLEMAIKNHYYEALDVMDGLLNHVFTGLNERYGKELAMLNEQYPFEPFKWVSPCPRLDFKEGCKLLKEEGYEQDPLDDLSTETERALGAIVRKKYGTDFYMLVGYPMAARPFYTMPDPTDERYTLSYDFFMRGEEITSGAQRVHIPELLEKQAKMKGMNVDLIKDYIDSFRYGAPPHAGCALGLERVVKLFVGLKDIRKCSMFPRDPRRIAP